MKKETVELTQAGMNKLSKISLPIRVDRWNSCLTQEWHQECRNRLHNQGFSEYRIEKYIGAWNHAVCDSIGWLGYTITPLDETDRLLSAAIEAADFDLEKFKLDHTTHPLSLNSPAWLDGLSGKPRSAFSFPGSITGFVD